MKEAAEAFPLHWPVGFKRTQIKKNSNFQCTLAQARDGVLAEIGRLKGTNVVISSNVPVKKDGNMYASMKPVDGDEGVAVYFTWKDQQYVLACDKYYYMRDNLRAIEKSIEAIRGLERWGASDMLSRAFSGFKAIGAGKEATQTWWEILGVQKDASPGEVRAAYKQQCKKYHPDNMLSGNNEMFLAIQYAYENYEINIK